MKFGAMVQPSIGDPDLPREIERLGYDSLWIPDSHMIASDCYAVMALAADEHLADPHRHRACRSPARASRPSPPPRSRPSTGIAPGRVFLGPGHGPHGDAHDGLRPGPAARVPRVRASHLRAAARRRSPSFTWRGKTRHIQFMHRQLGLIDLEHPDPGATSRRTGPKALQIAGEFGDGRVSRPTTSRPSSCPRARRRCARLRRPRLAATLPERLPRRHARLRLRDAAGRDAALRAGDRAGRRRCRSRTCATGTSGTRRAGDDALIPAEIRSEWIEFLEHVNKLETPAGPALSRAPRRSLHLPGPVRAPLRDAQRDPRRARLRGRAGRDHRDAARARAGGAARDRDPAADPLRARGLPRLRRTGHRALLAWRTSRRR